MNFDQLRKLVKLLENYEYCLITKKYVFRVFPQNIECEVKQYFLKNWGQCKHFNTKITFYEFENEWYCFLAHGCKNDTDKVIKVAKQYKTCKVFINMIYDGHKNDFDDINTCDCLAKCDSSEELR